MSGHGHVYPHVDGSRARCGGPTICSVCAREKAAKDFVEAPRLPTLSEVAAERARSDAEYRANVGRIASALARLADELVPRVEDEPVAECGLAAVRFFRGSKMDGRSAYVRMVDLGAAMPGVDMNNNQYEACTTLIQVNSGPWVESVTDRVLAEQTGNVDKFRRTIDFETLQGFGVDVSTLRDRDGRPI